MSARLPHRRGIPISLKTLDQLIIKPKSDAAAYARDAIDIAPELAPVASDLERAADTNALKEALSAYLQAKGRRLPRTDTGGPSLSVKAVKFVDTNYSKEELVDKI